MDSCFQRAHSEIDVIPVGGRKVNRIDGAGTQQPVVFAVAVEIFDTVFFANLCSLVFMPTDKRHDLAVAGVLDTGQKSSLRDPSDSDNGIANVAVLYNNCVGHSVNSSGTPCALRGSDATRPEPVASEMRSQCGFILMRCRCYRQRIPAGQVL